MSAKLISAATVRAIACLAARHLDQHGWGHPYSTVRDAKDGGAIEIAHDLAVDVVGEAIPLWQDHQFDIPHREVALALVGDMLANAATVDPELHQEVDRGLIYACLRRVEYLPEEDILARADEGDFLAFADEDARPTP